jgi:hypothetical protein
VAERNYDRNRKTDPGIGRENVAKDKPVSAVSGRDRKNLPSWATTIVVTVIVSILSSVTSVAVYDRFFAQKVVTANISKFVIDQRDLYFQGKIDRQQYVNGLTNFIALLKSQPKNRVIILEDVVAANAEKLEPR